MSRRERRRQIYASGRVVSISIRERAGLGAGVDPYFDARVGRMASSASRGIPAPESASGYIELVGGSPWNDLEALFAVLYEQPPPGSGWLYRIGSSLGLFQRPLAWTHIRGLRYLTTDGQTGVALPLNDFNPGEAAAGPNPKTRSGMQSAVERLDEITEGKLRPATKIGLTVSFDFGVLAGQMQPLLQPGWARRMLRPGERRRRTDVEQALYGGVTPVLDGMAPALGRWVGARRHAAQALGASGMASMQLLRAMRELRTGQTEAQANEPPDPDYGIAETGRGVIVGIVDFGCDFAHPSFIKSGSPDESRVLALWDQNEAMETPPPGSSPPSEKPTVEIGSRTCRFGYGRVFTRRRINEVLRQWRQTSPEDKEAPYRLLGYDPHDWHYTAKRPGTVGGPEAAHGLLVTQIAAGGKCIACPKDGRQPAAVSGVAREADIVFVQVRLHIDSDGRKVLDVNDVVDAVAYIFHVAEREQHPCAVNLSLNTMSGPHDGDGYFERRLAALMQSGRAGPASEGRAVVIAAGNLPEIDRRERRWQHLTDVVPSGGKFEFLWLMAAGDKTRNSVEIWYDADDTWLQVTLVSPAGEVLGPIAPGRAGEVLVDGQPRGSIIGSRPRPQMQDNRALEGAPPADGDRVPGRQAILLEVDPGASTAAGANGMVEWKIVLQVDGGAPSAAGEVPFHAWLERDDEGQSGICRPDPLARITDEDEKSTIGTLSCGREAIVVGAYDTVPSTVGPYGFTGQGPDRRGDIEKPDLSAPGHGILLLGSERQAMPCVEASGTSMAAPFVTGTIACIYEAWRQAPLEPVRQALVRSARRPPPQSQGWDAAFGNGRLNPKGALDRIKQFMPDSEAAEPLPVEDALAER